MESYAKARELLYILAGGEILNGANRMNYLLA